MSKYLLVFRDDPTSRAARKASPEELQQEMQKWMSWIGELTKKGHMQGGEPLEQGGKTVRGRKKEVRDGPYAEVKDVVNGYLVVSADSIDHAVELSRGCPILEGDGSVEVRPIQDMQRP